MRRNKISTGLIWRSAVIFLLTVGCFVVVGVRIFMLQTVNFDYYQKKVVDQLTTESTKSAKRGEIYDADGEVLATNITAYRIFISPSGINREKKEAQASGDEVRAKLDELIADGLAQILGSDRDDVLKLTEKIGSLDATVKREADRDEADKVLDFIAKNDLEDVLYVEAVSKRYYMYGDLASHVLGFTGTDGAGLYGLEYTYDKELSGTPGRYITARDSYGNEMPYEYQSFVDAVDGYDLHTTLKKKVQEILEEQLEATYKESASKAGVCGIVMNVKTGAIYAMATYPDFDNNNAWELTGVYAETLAASGYAEGSAEYRSLKGSLQLKMWQNKAITDTFIPGSTFKIITSAVALETGAVGTNETFTCNGYHIVAGIKIHCHKTRGHGLLTFAEGLQQSCNPIMMTVGARIGSGSFYEYVKNFGYLEKTGIDLPGEAQGLFFSPSSFNEVELATASFGQNFKVSLLQHLTAIASVANGGKLVTPYIVDRITDANGKTISAHETEVRRQVISTSVCETVADILEKGVSGNGGAKNAYVAGFRVAAKTGTSEKIGDDEEARVGSCVAFAPADDPEIAIIIMVDEPTSSSRYGSVVAAPYIANCLEQMLPYLGVEAKYTDAESEKLMIEVSDYTNSDIVSAKEKLTRAGLKYEIVGYGPVVTSQVPAAGQEMSKQNGKVILYTGEEEPSNTETVPNLVGMTASAANRLLINAGFNINIKGATNYAASSGAVVVSQYPAAGEKRSKGDVITVTFRYLDVTDD